MGFSKIVVALIKNASKGEHQVHKIIDWIRPISQEIVLMVLVIAGIRYDFAESLESFIKTVGYTNNELPDAIRIAAAYGRWPLTIVVILICILVIRNCNKGSILNSDNNIYHYHSFTGYWICRYLLGYKKCNLKLVPIPMQFKLVVNGIFPEFIVDKGIHSATENEIVKVREPQNQKYTTKVNLAISDTYKVRIDQIPSSVNSYTLIEIDRSSDDHTRYNSEKLVATVVSTVRNLPQTVAEINVFATTNPENTYNIANEAFATGDRDNIQHLYVFSQESRGNRNFKEKGYKIY